MNIKTLIKIIVSSIMIPIASFGILILTLFIIPNDMGLLLGIMLGASFMMLVIVYGYPIWFKDYIKEYWEKEEKKNEGNNGEKTS